MKSRGVLLERLNWIEAERTLRPETLVVLPLGAACKEHGPHLTLANDRVLAEYFRDRLLESCEVVAAPTIGFHYYPAFTEYPGSISLRLETARDLVVDIVRSIARHGPRRFYVLNLGVSTVHALAPAARLLADEGIALRFTNLLQALGPIERELGEQEGGTHADETETSMMLFIEPNLVDMARAVKDYHPNRPGGLTRDPQGPGTYSSTGIWGDPTLASRAKGERFCEALLQALIVDVEALRATSAPDPSTPAIL